MATDVTNTGRHIFDPKEVIDDYRIAVRSRHVDERERAFTKDRKALFCVLSAGQELAQIASVRPLRAGDWERGYYRSGAGALRLGLVRVREMLAQVLGNTEDGKDPSSGGRMMGRHFGSRLLKDGQPIDFMRQINHASDISSTGTQMPVAFGLARASRVFREAPELGSYKTLSNAGNEVALVSVGDGSLAEGISYEAIAQAVVQSVPLVISVLDNGFSISVPVDRQVPHGSISRALQGFRASSGSNAGLRIIGPVNGWDYPSLCSAYEEAFAHARGDRGPALVHAIVTQPFGHSSTGDHRRYKSLERLKWEEASDCIQHMRAWMVAQNFATESGLTAIEEEERAFVEAEAREAWREVSEPIAELVRSALDAVEKFSAYAPAPLQERIAGCINELRDKSTKPLDGSGATRNDVLAEVERVLYEGRSHRPPKEALSPKYEECYERIRGLRNAILDRARRDYSTNVYAEGAQSPCGGPRVDPVFAEDPQKDTQAHIIAAGIATLMSRDPRIVVYGEDTAKLGGVQTCTVGLQGGHASVPEGVWPSSFALHRYLPEQGFGEARVWDHAVAENAIIGGAVGMSLRGLRPIAEIQYLDYVVWALQQMVDEVASLRYRTDGGQACPMLIRTHGHQLMGMWHSGSPMGMVLSSCPGLRVLTPRNGLQAVGMYRAVMEAGDPAFSVEPLMSMYEKEAIPENLDEIRFPLGQSEVLREGGDVTIVTYGYCCGVARNAAEQLAAQGIEAEVVDLQTLNPLDLNHAAERSIKKTKKVLFLDEDIPEGATAIIAKALLRERGCWDHINGMTFVTAPHHKPPYGLDGKLFTKPQPRDVVAAIYKMFDEIQGGDRSL